MRTRAALVFGIASILGGAACVDTVCDNAEDICGRDQGQNDQVSCSDDYECSSLCIVQLRNCDLRSDRVRECVGKCVASNGRAQASLVSEPEPASESSESTHDVR